MRRASLTCIIITFIIFLSSPIFAASYYVATDGNDANAGTEDAPWLTVQHAASTLTAGDTVYIKAGTYNERVIPANSGTADSLITYTNYGTDTVIINGTGLSVPENAGLFHIEDKSYIIVSALQVKNAGSDNNSNGIYLASTDHVTIEKCYTYNTVSSGIGVWSSDNITVDGNEVELACNDGEQECITLATSSNFTVRNNIVHDNGAGTLGGEGIDIKDGSYEGSVYGNRVYNLNNRLGIYVEAWDKHTYNIDIYQNIVHDIDGADGFTVASEEGGLLENINIYNNIAYNNGACGFSFARNGNAVTHPMQDVTLINNTFYNNGEGAWGGGISVDNIDMTNTIIRNNIVSQNLLFQIEVEPDVPADSYSIDYNLIDGYRGYNEETYGDNYQTGNPLFADVSQANFHIKTGSPAIDNGSSSSALATDFDGLSRPQAAGYDIGAFEFSSSWYLAEGCTNNYSTWVLVQNPSSSDATINFTFMKPDSSTSLPGITVGSNRRYSLDINSIDGLASTDVSTMVTSSNNVFVIAERTMYWNSGGITSVGGHCSRGSETTATTWYLAEGCTSGFSTWVLVQNPGSTDALVRMTFMTPTGSITTDDFTVSASRRYSLDVSTVSGLTSTDVSTKILSVNGVGIIAERAMYWNSGGITSVGGHCSRGVTSTSTTWYLAEGCTNGFSTWILVQNPNSTSATVNMTFMTQTGSTSLPDITVAGERRYSLDVSTVSGLESTNVSTKVESTNGTSIIAERAMYWNSGGITSIGGHCSCGVTTPMTTWYLAEGCTNNYSTWVLVQNPSSADALVTFTFMTQTGSTSLPDITVAGERRYSLDVSTVSGLESTDVSTKVESTNNVGIIAERAMYWNSGGYTNVGGHVSSGVSQ